MFSVTVSHREYMIWCECIYIYISDYFGSTCLRATYIHVTGSAHGIKSLFRQWQVKLIAKHTRRSRPIKGDIYPGSLTKAKQIWSRKRVFTQMANNRRSVNRRDSWFFCPYTPWRFPWVKMLRCQAMELVGSFFHLMLRISASVLIWRLSWDKLQLYIQLSL